MSGEEGKGVAKDPGSEPTLGYVGPRGWGPAAWGGGEMWGHRAGTGGPEPAQRRQAMLPCSGCASCLGLTLPLGQAGSPEHRRRNPPSWPVCSGPGTMGQIQLPGSGRRQQVDRLGWGWWGVRRGKGEASREARPEPSLIYGCKSDTY